MAPGRASPARRPARGSARCTRCSCPRTEVVPAPVHPLAEPDRARHQIAGRPLDHGAAAACEALQAVLLDVPLRVEAEPRARRRPRSTGPGSRSRSGSAGGSPAAPCSAGTRPSASGPTRWTPRALLCRDRTVDEAEPRSPRAFLPGAGRRVRSRSQRSRIIAFDGVVVRLRRQGAEHGRQVWAAVLRSLGSGRATIDYEVVNVPDPEAAVPAFRSGHRSSSEDLIRLRWLRRTLRQDTGQGRQHGRSHRHGDGSDGLA